MEKITRIVWDGYHAYGVKKEWKTLAVKCDNCGAYLKVVPPIRKRGLDGYDCDFICPKCNRSYVEVVEWFIQNAC